MSALNPASFLLIGVSLFYSSLIRVMLFPFSLIKGLFAPSGRYSGSLYYRYGVLFQLLGFGKLVTIGVVALLFFNKDLIVSLPASYIQALGVLCLVTACASLYLVAQGFVSIVLQAVFWIFIFLSITNAFFPNIYSHIRDNKITRSFLGEGLTASISSMKYRSINADGSRPIAGKTGKKIKKVQKEKNEYEKLKAAGLITVQSSNPFVSGFNQILSFLGLGKDDSTSFKASPEFGKTKNAIPENAYYPTRKSKLSGTLGSTYDKAKSQVKKVLE
jgi:hypothetical protein